MASSLETSHSRTRTRQQEKLAARSRARDAYSELSEYAARHNLRLHRVQYRKSRNPPQWQVSVGASPPDGPVFAKHTAGDGTLNVAIGRASEEVLKLLKAVSAVGTEPIDAVVRLAERVKRCNGALDMAVRFLGGDGLWSVEMEVKVPTVYWTIKRSATGLDEAQTRDDVVGMMNKAMDQQDLPM